MVGFVSMSCARPGGMLRRAAIATAATGIGAGALLALAGCNTIGMILVDAAMRACVELVCSLFDAPVATLPSGFVPCGSNTWELPDRRITFCAYCSSAPDGTIYVQMDCDGPYFPLRARRLVEPPASDVSETVSIERYDCDDRFLAEIGTMVDLHRRRATAELVLPSARTCADRSGYDDLDVRVDGRAAPATGDFEVAAGSRLSIDGDLDEVAHYAMTIGVEELSFADGPDRWTVYANASVSAIATYRNGAFEEARFLFAPTP